MSYSTPPSQSGTSTPTSIHTPHHSMSFSLSLKRKVLIIGTGGTIASEPTAQGYSPLRNDSFYRRIRQHPQLTDPFYTNHPTKPTSAAGSVQEGGDGLGAGTTVSSTTSFSSEVHTTQVGVNTLYEELVTPPLDDKGTRVGYEILDLDKHMDSSEMTPAGESATLIQNPFLGRSRIHQPTERFSCRFHHHPHSSPRTIQLQPVRAIALSRSLLLTSRMEHYSIPCIRQLGPIRRLHHSLRNRHPCIHFLYPHIPLHPPRKTHPNHRRPNPTLSTPFRRLDKPPR